ncbi:conserved Plasmodium protein, unknown function [Plasmodium ovale]|uniref:Phosphatidylinositol-4-phosphate-5-kinase n=2 Tax=Plasmodium ovale TaxID=36330 RepID=A0A1A8WZP6_PLAOA|nr:phosphatidylinositol-4-phosphate-5-kinase [Plasmodium ovale curtisi]SCP05668.1 conserved Plasmodium protein, unknown function [Plasmodium ovale]
MKCCGKNSVNVESPKKPTQMEMLHETLRNINCDDLPTTTLILNDGSTYTGTILDEKIHGRGVLKNPNGEIYEGEFVYGRKHGLGKWSNKEGNSYEGLWKEDRKHGYGVYITEDGYTFEGNFNMNKRDGIGTTITPDGIKYICNFKDDVEVGEVEFFFPNGDHAFGYIKDGYLHENGRYEFKNGDIYVGYFEKGLFHGKGYYKWHEDSSYVLYEGNYVEGKKHGTGQLTRVDGRILCGEFRDNHLEGEFLEISPQGNKTRVLYEKSKFVKIIEKIQDKVNIKEFRMDAAVITSIFSDPTFYKKLYEVEKKKKSKFHITLRK